MSAIIIEEKGQKMLLQKLLHVVLEHYATAEELTENLKARIISLNHPDIKLIERPEGKGSIGIPEIKEIKKFVSFYPYEAKFKAILIPSANEMTPEAQNALLKTLEEHSDTTFFVLGTNSRKNLLPTILSRCGVETIQKEDVEYLKDIEALVENVEEASQSLNDLKLSDIDKIFSQKDLNKKEKALELLRKTIEEEREILRTALGDSKKAQTRASFDKVNLLQKLVIMVERNTNPKLVVERFLIEYI